MPSADTSATERIRRLKAKTIAAAVAEGAGLAAINSYDPVMALTLGHSCARVERPGGPAITAACGCNGRNGGGGGATLVCGGPDISISQPGPITVVAAECQEWQISGPTRSIFGKGPATVTVTEAGKYSLTCFLIPITFLPCNGKGNLIIGDACGLRYGLPSNATSITYSVYTGSPATFCFKTTETVTPPVFVFKTGSCSFPVTIDYETNTLIPKDARPVRYLLLPE